MIALTPEQRKFLQYVLHTVHEEHVNRKATLDALAAQAAPCPFCTMDKLGIEAPFDFYVLCPGCGARGPLSTTAEQAVTLWNMAHT